MVGNYELTFKLNNKLPTVQSQKIKLAGDAKKVDLQRRVVKKRG